MIIIAFDPGRITSYARLDSLHPHSIDIGELELIGSGRLRRPCPIAIADLLQGVDAAVVEEVGARSDQGVSAMFTFGLSLGCVLGAISACGIPVELVSPQAWKNSARLGKLGRDESKRAAREMAKELYPAHAKIFNMSTKHGMAEAALMARWYFLRGPGRDVVDLEACQTAAE